MEKLKKAYEAVKTLESLGMPVSKELIAAIAQLEKEYIQEELIPYLENECASFVENLMNPFHIGISYSKEDGLSLRLSEYRNQVKVLPPVEANGRQRVKRNIIRVTFPDGKVSCQQIVTNTFIDVMRYAGARNVERVGILVFGKNMISTSLSDNIKHRTYQHEVEPGYYVNTYCNTNRKFEFLKIINRELNLNLKIEMVPIV